MAIADNYKVSLGSTVGGFTIIEMFASLAILSLLISLAFISYQPAMNAAQSMLCISRMRSLHTGLSANLADSGSWPQPPEALNEESLENWWINQLLPYGITPKTWLCPTAKKIFDNDPNSSTKSSYAVSRFDTSPRAPFKWALQPWMIEVVGVHSDGPHVCFPDGSIKNLNSLLKAK
jgi:type II secretory pathway pseudopilin PulG